MHGNTIKLVRTVTSSGCRLHIYTEFHRHINYLPVTTTFLLLLVYIRITSAVPVLKLKKKSFYKKSFINEKPASLKPFMAELLHLFFKFQATTHTKSWISLQETHEEIVLDPHLHASLQPSFNCRTIVQFSFFFANKRKATTYKLFACSALVKDSTAAGAFDWIISFTMFLYSRWKHLYFWQNVM